MEYPGMLNLPLTERCDSRCVMCGCWRQKPKAELLPAQYAAIFRQDIFRDVRDVAASGGEPLLREDFADLIHCILASFPHLRNVFLTSNGLSAERVRLVAEAKSILSPRGIKLNYFLSLDGVGETHARVRGIPHAFERVLDSITKARRLGIAPQQLHCTVSRVNVHGLEEVLRFANEEDIHIIFRLAVPIRRLHNLQFIDNIALTQADRYEFSLFLFKLLHEGYEQNPQRKNIYASLIRALNIEPRRSCGCWAWTSGMFLAPDGSIAACSVHAETIGNMQDPHDKPWMDLLAGSRAALRAGPCSTCLHDYTDEESQSTLDRRRLDTIKGMLLNSSEATAFLRRHVGEAKVFPGPGAIKNMRRITIVGWYGTETAGDKLILAGIVSYLLALNNSLRFDIISMNPFVTANTVRELGHERIFTIRPFTLQDFMDSAVGTDLAIIGGGPLMEIDPIEDLMRFQYVMLSIGKPFGILGSGIGPVYSEHFATMISSLVENAQFALLRDAQSVQWLEQRGITGKAAVWLDPSMHYILKCYPGDIRLKDMANGRHITVCLRKITCEYSKDLGKNAHADLLARIQRAHTTLINNFIRDGFIVHLIPMHTFCIGGDDREYYRELLPDIDGKDQIRFHQAVMPPQAILDYMRQSELVVGMRFHSVVFATCLGVPTLACDYGYASNQHGKIFSYMDSLGLQRFVIDMRSASGEDMHAASMTILRQRETAGRDIAMAVRQRYRSMERAYAVLGTPAPSQGEEDRP